MPEILLAKLNNGIMTTNERRKWKTELANEKIQIRHVHCIRFIYTVRINSS